MAKLQLVVTDPSGKAAIREGQFSEAEWTALVAWFDGWKRAHTPNPEYDPGGPDDEASNPPTIPVADRWHIVDQLQASFQRAVRESLKKSEQEEAQARLDAATEAARTNLVITDKGDTQTRVKEGTRH